MDLGLLSTAVILAAASIRYRYTGGLMVKSIVVAVKPGVRPLEHGKRLFPSWLKELAAIAGLLRWHRGSRREYNSHQLRRGASTNLKQRR